MTIETKQDLINFLGSEPQPLPRTSFKKGGDAEYVQYLGQFQKEWVQWLNNLPPAIQNYVRMMGDGDRIRNLLIASHNTRLDQILKPVTATMCQPSQAPKVVPKSTKGPAKKATKKAAKKATKKVPGGRSKK